MPPTSAAMELKVLISVLQSGTALQTLLNQTKQLTAGLTQLQQQAGKVTIPPPPTPPKEKIDETTKALANLDQTVQKVISGLKFLAGGFLALESVRFLKDLADTAARAQVLSTVLHVVGSNAGYSTEKLDKASRQIQALGITAIAANQSLTQFIQAELELADAPLLARAAQDAAVILGTNSSEAFERLVTAVQTTNTLMLRHMGIIVSADTAYQKYAVSIGKSVTQLTSAQRAQAFLNATLVQTTRIQGSYTAAMGDVGKQLTSLDRLTTDLKTSLGNNLLPAYLAIVEELTLFMQHLGLAADEMYGQGEGAKKLGEDVKGLAHNFRILAEFAVEHRKEIAAILILWASISKVLVPLIELFGGLWAAISGTAEGGALALLIRGLGLFGTALVGIGILLVGAMFYFEKFNAAVGSGVGAIWTLLEVVDLIIYAVTGGLVAALKMLFNMLAHPLSPEEWLKPWKDWAAGVAAQIKWIGELWENTKARFKQAIGSGEPTPQENAQATRAQRFEQEADLLSAIIDKTREYNDLKKTGSAEQLTAAEKDLKAMKDKASKMTEARKAEQDELKYNPQMKENEQKKLDVAVANRQEDAIIKRLDKVREQSKYWYFDGEVSKPFMEQIGQFNDLLEIFNRAGNKAKITTDELGRNFVEAAATAKTKADLLGIRKSLTDLVNSPEFKKLSQADQRALRGRAERAVEGAVVNVRQETLRENAEIERLREQHFRQLEKRRADHYDHEKNLMASAFELQEAMDEQSYSRRGMDSDLYFDKRLVRLQEQTAQELVTAKNHLAALEREREQHIPRTPQDVEELNTKIAEAQAAIQELQGDSGTIAVRIAKLGIEREDAREDKLKRSKQTLLDIAAIHGSEADALAAVNNKYDEQYNKANTAEERAAIQAERKNDIFDTELKFREQAYQLELDILQIQTDQLDVAKSQRDVQAVKDKDLRDSGEISEYELQRRTNARLDADMTDNRRRKELEEQKRRSQRNQQAEEEIKLIGRLQQEGKSEAEIKRQTTIQWNEAQKGIDATTASINGLDVAYAELAAASENYSDKLKESFENAFSDALTKTIMDFRKAGDAWKSMATSITEEIISIFVKAFTQNLFKKLGVFSFADRLMARFFGGGGAASFSAPGMSNAGGAPFYPMMAEGGMITGPGTGTSDSVPILASAGEHIMPAARTAQFLPLLEGIRTGKILPFARGGVVQSIALPSLIPRRYAAGGVVVSDGGAGAVQTNGGGPSNMVVTMHPDTLNMTMREWLEHEVVRQQGRR